MPHGRRGGSQSAAEERWGRHRNQQKGRLPLPKGLGEAVSTALSEHCPTPVTRIGVNDVYGHSGPAVDLLKEFGLSAEHIAEVIREKLAK